MFPLCCRPSVVVLALVVVRIRCRPHSLSSAFVVVLALIVVRAHCCPCSHCCPRSLLSAFVATPPLLSPSFPLPHLSLTSLSPLLSLSRLNPLALLPSPSSQPPHSRSPLHPHLDALALLIPFTLVSRSPSIVVVVAEVAAVCRHSSSLWRGCYGWWSRPYAPSSSVSRWPWWP